MKNLEQIIDQWIGEEKAILNSPMDNYEHPEYDQAIGYNEKIQDFKSRKQELVKEIEFYIDSNFGSKDI